MTIKEEPKKWKKDIASFEQSDLRQSLWQLFNTLVPFFAFWCLAYRSLSVSFWISLAIVVPAAGFLVRTFIIFHDCCHNSFFKSRRANVMVGVITGLMAFFPYYQWKHEHAIHHATSSNLNRRGTGDIWMLTVDEYLALPLLHRILYRVYRNPFVLFGLGPIFIFLILYRFANKRAGQRERWNTYATDFVLVVMTFLLCWTLGWQQFLLVEGSILYLSGIVGIWLFYVQHQFEYSYFEREEEWDYVSAAIGGSSFYKLPKVLQWITGNIGFHHIHHLSSRIPNYKLQRVYESDPAFQNVPSIVLLSSLRSLRYRLWDEESKTFVTFKDLMDPKFARRTISRASR